MAQDDTIKEEFHYEHNQVMLSVKRHINMGEGSFQNAETKLFALSKPNITDQLEALREIRQAINIWESEERENYLRMQQLIKEQEETLVEVERVRQDTLDAKFRIELMDHIKENPSCGIDDLVLTFELSRYQINNHLDFLVNQGKIKHAECRLSFLVDKDGFTEEDEEL